MMLIVVDEPPFKGNIFDLFQIINIKCHWVNQNNL